MHRASPPRSLPGEWWRRSSFWGPPRLASRLYRRRRRSRCFVAASWVLDGVEDSESRWFGLPPESGGKWRRLLYLTIVGASRTEDARDSSGSPVHRALD